MVVRKRQKKKSTKTDLDRAKSVKIRKRKGITEHPITSPKMLKFIEEYPKDWNPRRAAFAAGYSKKNISVRVSWLLRNIRVKRALKEVRERNRKDLEISSTFLLKELSRIIKFDIRKVYHKDGRIKQVHELDDDTAAAIAGLDIDALYVGRGNKREQIGETKKYKIANKLGAIELAGKSIGMFIDDRDFEGGDLTIRIVEDKGNENESD